MPYEALSLALRVTIFDTLFDSSLVKQLPAGQTFIPGAIAGSVSQMAVQPFFLSNLRNQNCFDQMKTRAVEKMGWVALRGAMLGVCHLSVYKTVL